jgi:GNAT superfamily N-acetyltransferase
LVVRDAEEADLPTLTAIKGDDSGAVHRDRLRDARVEGFRYLVLTIDQEIVGFAGLVFRRPDYWSDADNTQHLPQIVDLRIKELQRGRGYGSAFIRALERVAASAGYRQLYLSVDPINNPRAYALYRRVGYTQLQSEPYRDTWHFRDSAGQEHRGEGWALDMEKQLGI